MKTTRKSKHETFALQHKHRTGRLKYGLDYVKAMPPEWTEEQRLATMVELYDELVDATHGPQ